MNLETPHSLFTADDLWQLPDDGQKYELVAGELFPMPPGGFLHGAVAMNLGALLQTHVRTHDLGVVCTADAGFRLRQNPDTVRAPDIAFVSKERVLAQGRPEKFWPGPPDLAVEVMSPNDSFDDVVGKVREYLTAGVRLVWVVLPRAKSVMVYRPDGSVQLLQEQDELSGIEVLPGFRCQVGLIFA